MRPRASLANLRTHALRDRLPHASARSSRPPPSTLAWSSRGRASSSKSAGFACASAVVQPTTALRTSFESRFLELGVRLLGGDDDDLRSAQAAQVAIELVRDVTEVLRHELLDVPLEARLRPAALVVPPWCLLGLVGDLHELRRSAAGTADRARDRRPPRSHRLRARSTAPAERGRTRPRPGPCPGQGRKVTAHARRCRGRQGRWRRPGSRPWRTGSRSNR